jgi:hypothetical protein
VSRLQAFNMAKARPIQVDPPHVDPPHVDPPRGERGESRKVTITLPPKAYEQLVKESARRKIAKEPNHLLSAVIREALHEYLRK